MTITLHEKLKPRLRQILARSIARLEVRTAHIGMLSLLDVEEPCISAIPTDVRAQLVDQVGEGAFSLITFSMIQDELNALPLDQKPVDGPLSQVPGFEDPEATAERVLQLIERLPLSYICTVKLSQSMATTYEAAGRPAIIGDSIALVGSWHKESESYPNFPGQYQPRGLRHIFGDAERKEAENSGPVLSLHLTVRGYVSDHIPTQPEEIAVGRLKSFIGLCLAGKIFGRGLRRDFAYEGRTKISQGCGAKFNAVRELNLGRSDAELLANLSFRSTAHEPVQYLTRVVALLEEVPKSESLVLAGRWLYDSEANHDRAMAFMQAAIVAEVVLGQGEQNEDIGLTVMLANRCAYMLATSTVERSELMATFKAIYKTRSKIVHTGVMRSNSDSFSQLRQLRNICDRIIQHEMRAVFESHRIAEEERVGKQAMRSLGTLSPSGGR